MRSTYIGLSLPSAPAGELDRLKAVVEEASQRIPALDITVDPVENRGFEYHAGIGFTFFARGERGEIGAGRRYVILPNGNEDENGEERSGNWLHFVHRYHSPGYSRGRSPAARVRAGWVG